MTRVLFITPWFPDGPEDISGIFVSDQAAALQSAGCTVRVIHAAATPPGGAERSGRAAASGVPVQRVNVRGGPETLHQVRVVLAACRAALALRRTGFRPDIVHAHTDKAAPAGWAVARLSGARFGVTEHSSEWIDADGVPPAARRQLLARRTFRAATFVIAVSTRLATALQKMLAVERIDVVPNTVDELFFATAAAPRAPLPQLLATGSLVREKDFGLLLEAFALILAQRPCELTLIGTGPLGAELADLAQQLDVSAAVHFAGQQPRTSVAQALAAADVYICSSSIETFGVAVAEALASGVPVVSTRCGGPEDFVTSEVGVLVDARAAPALAEAILEVLDRPDADRELVRAYARARFSSPVVAAKLLAIYQRTAVSAEQQVPTERP